MSVGASPLTAPNAGPVYSRRSRVLIDLLRRQPSARVLLLAGLRASAAAAVAAAVAAAIVVVTVVAAAATCCCCCCGRCHFCRCCQRCCCQRCCCCQTLLLLLPPLHHYRPPTFALKLTQLLSPSHTTRTSVRRLQLASSRRSHQFLLSNLLLEHVSMFPRYKRTHMRRSTVATAADHYDGLVRRVV